MEERKRNDHSSHSLLRIPLPREESALSAKNQQEVWRRPHSITCVEDQIVGMGCMLETSQTLGDGEEGLRHSEDVMVCQLSNIHVAPLSEHLRHMH